MTTQPEPHDADRLATAQALLSHYAHRVRALEDQAKDLQAQLEAAERRATVWQARAMEAERRLSAYEPL